MTTTITGATGVNQITDDAITSAKLPTGSVLQVIGAVVSSTTTVSSNSYADISLQAAITPSSASNNILISVNVPLRKNNGSSNDTAGHIRIVRGSTVVQEFGRYLAWNNTSSKHQQQTAAFQCLDINADTTSATTYKVQLKASINGMSVASCHDSSQASITLMEIAG
tara:strand:- start:19 stop:519 length:501 start_codon:yes stop_codon:yes gene_type:complete